MKELLERLSKVMPDDWRIEQESEGVWLLSFKMGPFKVSMYEVDGDIGLAPLTAVLEQDIERREGEFHVQCTLGKWDFYTRFEDDDVSGGGFKVKALGKDSHFEATATVYLSLLEKQ